MPRKVAGYALFIAFVLLACNVPFATFLPDVALSGSPLATPVAQPSQTSSPFAPLAPTHTPEFTPTPAITPTPTFDPQKPWGRFPGPTVSSAIEIHPPVDELKFDSSVVNFVLLGSDRRPYTGGYRTDVIMIVSLNPSRGTATLLSIPRDLYVYIPGWRVNRINTAEPRGGYPMLADTILYNFGIPIHHWGRMDFGGFIQAVDLMGGIDVDVGRTLNDKCGDRYYYFPPGTHHMNGWTAHCYVRMRKASSDFDRLRRQQEVMQAIFKKFITLEGITKVPQFYSQFSTFVQTDVTLPDLLPLVPLGASIALDDTRVQRYSIDATMTTSFRVPSSGAAVQLPNWDQIEELLATAFAS